MKKTFFTLLLSFIITTIGLSQVFDPVSWSFHVEENGTETILVSTATIDDGWHVYAQVLESDMGPVPTEFTFEPNANYKLVGKNEESKTYKEYDKNFEMNLSYFKDKAVFKQKIENINDSESKPYRLSASIGTYVGTGKRRSIQ